MLSDATKQKTQHWVALFFCVCLGLIVIVMSLLVSGTLPVALVPFFCFLPMCFFYVGSTTSNLHREIRELRQQVADLQSKQP